MTHAHTNVARHIVNSLIIARLTRKAPEFRAKIAQKQIVNSSTMTIVFEIIEGQQKGIS